MKLSRTTSVQITELQNTECKLAFRYVKLQAYIINYLYNIIIIIIKDLILKQSHRSTLLNTTYVSSVIVYESQIFFRSPLGRCTFWELERDREKRAKKGGHCASYVRKVPKAPPPLPTKSGFPGQPATWQGRRPCTLLELICIQSVVGKITSASFVWLMGGGVLINRPSCLPYYLGL